MSQVKQLLHLYKQGESKKSMAPMLDISRNTVKAYLNKLTGVKSDINELLALEDPVLNKRFHGGNPSFKEDRYSYLKNRLGYYTSELRKTGVTRQLLWEEYINEYPNGYGRSQFFHHLAHHKKAAKPYDSYSRSRTERYF